MEKHEIVIVGAGPAGLKAAELLAKAKKDVLIVEKKPENKIGDKVCAGGLTPKTMMLVPEELYEKVFYSGSLYINDKPITYKTEYPLIATVNRHELGQYMLKEAKSSGANIIAGKAVETLKAKENMLLLADEEEIRYDYLIGADGSSSRISRALGLRENIVMGVDYLVKGNFEEISFYVDISKLGLAAACIFPHNNFAHVEAGTFTSLMQTSVLRENFKRWCSEKGIDLSKAKFSAAPLNFAYNGFRHSNIFLVGDAASFLCTVDGEGIYQAIKSGEIAAKCIIDPKWDYKPDLRDLLKYHKIGAPFIPLIKAMPKSLLNSAGKTVLNLSSPLIPRINNLINTFTFIPEVGLKYIAR